MTISALELSFVEFCCIVWPLRPSPDDLGDVVGVAMVEVAVVGVVVVRGGVGGIGISLLA